MELLCTYTVYLPPGLLCEMVNPPPSHIRCGLHSEAGGPVPCIRLSALVPVSTGQVQRGNGTVDMQYAVYPCKDMHVHSVHVIKDL